MNLNNYTTGFCIDIMVDECGSIVDERNRAVDTAQRFKDGYTRKSAEAVNLAEVCETRRKKMKRGSEFLRTLRRDRAELCEELSSANVRNEQLEDVIFEMGFSSVLPDNNDFYLALKDAYSICTNGRESDFDNSARRSADLLSSDADFLSVDGAVLLLQEVAGLSRFNNKRRNFLLSIPVVSRFVKKYDCGLVSGCFNYLIESGCCRVPVPDLINLFKKSYAFDYSLCGRAKFVASLVLRD